MRLSVMLGIVGALGTPAVAQNFTLSSYAFGESGGTPLTLSGGGRFFVESSRELQDNTPDLTRPMHASSWNDGDNREWSTYFTQDALGPSRRFGPFSPNNASDQFYLIQGIYPPAFASRNANLVTFSPGLGGDDPAAMAARMNAVTSGVLVGGASIPGTPIVSRPGWGVLSIPPPPFPAMTISADGIMLARLTVTRGAFLLGSMRLIGTIAGVPFDQTLQTSFGVSPELFPAAPGVNNRLFLTAYRVAEVNITANQFGTSEPFGEAEVYDIWLHDYRVIPSPSAAALIAACGCFALHRRQRIA
jgi:hypothetical protein